MSRRIPLSKHISYLCQTGIIYIVYGFFAALPLDMASALGGLIGRVIGPRLGVSRRAMHHITFVFPDKSAVEKKAILGQMWDNLGRNFAETPHLATLMTHQRISVHGLEHIKAAVQSGRPIMCVSGHFGNWEIGPMALWHAGIPLTVVYRKPNNPYIDRLLKKVRRAVTPQLLAKGHEGARGIMRRLREGMGVGLLVDQKMNQGESIAFLGRPAMTGMAPAYMALTTKAAIFPAVAIRQNGAFFKIVIQPEIVSPYTDNTEKAMDLTQQINDYLSDHIRAYPGQWLWLHRRWGKNLVF